LLRGSEQELVRRIQGEQRALAEVSARGVADELMGAVEALARAADLIDWLRASPRERQGGLSLLANSNILFDIDVRLRLQQCFGCR